MKRILLVLVAWCLSACATLSPIDKPDVAITSLALGPNTGMQQQLKIGLRLDNPNNFALNLGALRYSVNLAGNDVATGRFTDGVSVPANDWVDIVVPVEVNLFSGLGLLRSIMSNSTSELDYVLSLTADVKNFGLGSITVDKSGKVGLGPSSGVDSPAPAR